MNREQKAAVVDEVATQIEGADAIFAIDYRGLSVTQAVELRARLGEADATFRVVKNRLTWRAADQAGAESLKELLEGPTAFTFVHGDAALAAKALANFRRDHGLLEFKGGTMDGEPLSAEQIDSISKLPAREALQGQFVGMLASPLTGLVRSLGGMLQGLALQLGQIQEKGLVGGGADSEAGASGAAEAPEAEVTQLLEQADASEGTGGEAKREGDEAPAAEAKEE